MLKSYNLFNKNFLFIELWERWGKDLMSKYFPFTYDDWFLHFAVLLILRSRVCSLQVIGGTHYLITVGKRTNLLPWCTALQHNRTSTDKSQSGKGSKHSSTGKCWHEQSKEDSVLCWVLQHASRENGRKGKISSPSWSMELRLVPSSKVRGDML